jgi:hypothetical protein
MSIPEREIIRIQNVPPAERLQYLLTLHPAWIRSALDDVANRASADGDYATFWQIHALAQAGCNAVATDLEAVRSEAREDIEWLAPLILESVDSIQARL